MGSIWMRDRCVIPGTCIVPDPYHGPDECHTGADVAAYEAGLRGDQFVEDCDELGAGDA